MLPDIGASELLVIAIVALIVVGPKDLPPLLRRLGQMLAKLRGMAAEFRASFDEMARQSELDELRREVEAMRRGHAEEMAAFHANEAELARTFDEINQGAYDGMTPGAVYQQSVMAPQVQPAPEPAPEPPAVAEPAPAPKPRNPRAPKAKAPTVEGASGKPRARRSGTVT
jgi:sec-independent protein translocase protein TatB